MSIDELHAEASRHVTKDQLIQDFKVMAADAEALLKATAGHSGDAVADVRDRMAVSLETAKARMAQTQEAMLAKARAAAKTTDQYVHEHPWKAVGTAAGVGLLLGMLIGRR